MDIITRIMDFLTGLRAETESTPPATEQRDIGMQQVYEQIAGQVDALGWSSGGWAMINDIYTSADGSMSVLFSMAGKLYRAPIMMSGTNAILGTLVEFEMPPMATRSIQIMRQADGTSRWLAVAAASVLNRVGEIDSRTLFDSFTANVATNGYPQLRFYHDARLVMGQADWVARDDNLYLASGTLADNVLGQAFAEASTAGRGKWGCSIGFMPTKPAEMVEIARDVQVPVYVAGVNTEISVLPEEMAASWFTTIGLEVTRAMDEAKRKALIALIGDETRAMEFITSIDATNRSISEAGLVTRETPGHTETPQEAQERHMAEVINAAIERHATTEAEKAAKLSAEEKAKYESDLTAKIMAAVDASLGKRLPALEEALAGSAKKDQERSQAAATLDKRIKDLETAEQEHVRVHNEDMPRVGASNVTYQPRAEQRGTAQIDSDAAAAPMLEKLHAAQQAGR